MTLSVWLAFIATSLLLAIAPGPDNLFVLVQGAVFGARAGLVVVAGLIAGILCQTMAAALGVAAVVAASPMLFWAIRLLGACYLLYLAYMSWTHPIVGSQQSQEMKGYWPLFRRGLIMNVTNPKVQIFFLAFFPQFVSAGADSVQTVIEMVILGLSFMLATAAVFGGIAVCAGALADLLRSDKFQFYLNRTSSVIFVGLAASTVFLT